MAEIITNKHVARAWTEPGDLPHVASQVDDGEKNVSEINPYGRRVEVGE